MAENAQGTKGITLEVRIGVVNEHHTMREALVQSTHLKSHRDLIHRLNRYFVLVRFMRMNNFVIITMFELIIILLYGLKVFVEREH